MTDKKTALAAEETAVIALAASSGSLIHPTTIQAIKDTLSIQAWKEYKTEMPKVEAKTWAKYLESLTDKARGKLDYRAMQIGFRAAEGNARAGQEYLLELLMSGLWVDAAASHHLDVSSPKQFLYTVITDEIKMSRATGTLWSDAYMVIMHLYNPEIQNILSVQPAQGIPESPYACLHFFFGDMVQIASPWLRAYESYRGTGLPPAGATWEILSKQHEDWTGMSQDQIKQAILSGFFDPFHELGDHLAKSRAYLAIREMRRLLNLAWDAELKQRQKYDQARGDAPDQPLVRLLLKHLVGLNAAQIAALRSIPWIEIAEEVSEHYEIQVRQELRPFCPQCSSPLYVGSDHFYCPEEERQVEDIKFLDAYEFRVADLEVGFEDDWTELPGRPDLDSAASYVVHVGPLTAVYYDLLLPFAKFHDWVASAKTRFAAKQEAKE